MAKTVQCREPKCTEAALNKKLQLKSGGTALCQYCAAHAVARGFVVPATAPSKPTAN
jgi:hypothetical protein